MTTIKPATGNFFGDDRPAIISGAGERSFRQLSDNACRLIHYLRRQGLQAGDAVALLCSNRPEFVETVLACRRAGYWLTPVNWHLGPGEAAYIIQDCGAKALIAEDRFPAAADVTAPALHVRLSIGFIGGFAGYDDALAGEEPAPVEDGQPQKGGQMLYTSGTTGRPKGVRKPPRNAADEAVRQQRWPGPFLPGQSVALNTGPLYHAAPLKFDLVTPLFKGVTVVLMDKWDPEECLRLIDKHRVTHLHLVPTMFHRLLSLPTGVRQRYDLSSVTQIMHGAAPTPVHIKKAMIEWLGPVLFEYYGGSEGGGTDITSAEWLQKPGSVGRAWYKRQVDVLGENGQLLPPGKSGKVFFSVPEEDRFHYHGDSDKTANAYNNGRFTLGDVGYLDEDGYLFLTGRSSEVIIAGGVNIYPAEIDAVLLKHPAVADAAAVGIPHEVYGEEVKAVVEPAPGHAPDPGLAEELIAHCREHLASYKCPRSIDFTDQLLRSDAGKVKRREIRAAYWAGRDKQI